MLLTWVDLLYFNRIQRYFCIILFVQLTPKYSIGTCNILHHNPLLQVHKNFYNALTTFYLILAAVHSKCDITKDKLYTFCNN